MFLSIEMFNISDDLWSWAWRSWRCVCVCVSCYVSQLCKDHTLWLCCYQLSKLAGSCTAGLNTRPYRLTVLHRADKSRSSGWIYCGMKVNISYCPLTPQRQHKHTCLSQSNTYQSPQHVDLLRLFHLTRRVHHVTMATMDWSSSETSHCDYLPCVSYFCCLSSVKWRDEMTAAVWSVCYDC